MKHFALIILFGLNSHAASVQDCPPGAQAILEAAIEATNTYEKPQMDLEVAIEATVALCASPVPVYTVNEDRHGKGANGNPAASKLPTNAEELFHHSLPVVDGRGRISWWSAELMNRDCVYHRFQGANNEVHWNGSTRATHAGGLVTKMKDVPVSMREIYRATVCRSQP